MDGVFAGQQTIAKDATRAAQDDTSAMAGCVADEQILYILRMIELELPVTVGCQEADTVAEAIGVALQTFRGIDRKELACAKAGPPRRAWRKGVYIHDASCLELFCLLLINDRHGVMDADEDTSARREVWL